MRRNLEEIFLEIPFSQLWELDQLAVVDGYQEDELSLHSSY